MRRLALLFCGTLSGLVAFGQSPLDCLDPDVLRSLLLPGRGEQSLAIGTAVPPELASVKAPRQFTWVGSGERSSDLNINGNIVTQESAAAVYRTSQAPEAARAAASAALADAGWQQRNEQFVFGTEVFVSANARQVSDTFCRDEAQTNLVVNALDGVTYVVMTAQRQPRNNVVGLTSACSRSAPPFSPRPASAMDQYLPKLEVPRDPATGNLLSTTGGGRSGGATKNSFSIGFTLRDTAANVARHFDEQMAAQGWTRDAGWSNTGTAGSTWIKRPDADTTLQGTMMVSGFEDDRFTVMLRINRTK